jgi:hypothetical protein
MTYIIENANILKETNLVTTSLVIKENQIAFMGNNVKRYQFMKMNAAPYLMTPTYVLFDSLYSVENSFQEKKDYFLKKFMLKGCTTLLTFVDIRYESELSTKLKKMKLELLSSAIDYVIGVKVPLSLITSSFIRSCKREKVPAIFIDLKETDKLSSVPWGWIREAMFPYNSPLIPFVSGVEPRDKKRILNDWSIVLENQKIPHFEEPLIEGAPLSVPDLSKIGLIPLKSSIRQGGEISYNLYIKNRELMNIDVHNLFHYHNDRLLVTVHKGVVIRSGNSDIYYRSGFGEHVIIKTPSFFSISK